MAYLSALFLLLLVSLSPAFADDIQTVPVHFPSGASRAVINGTLKWHQSISYTLGAEAGQTMRVLLRAKGSTSFNLYGPGQKPGADALAIGELNNGRFEGALPQSGTYTINVFLNRAAARRNERSQFTLDVAIASQNKMEAPVKNDFADGLQGGPDYWRVNRGRAPLAMRSAPSDEAKIVMRFDEGGVLRNRGCRMVKGARWCQVEFPGDASVTGWVRGERLREGTPPTSDARVPGTLYHATGTIPCAVAKGQPTTPCRFGVVRQGLGRAVITVFPPGGVERIIYFENGVPSAADVSNGARLSFTRNADLFLISINAERYEIPQAVIGGG